MADTDNAKTTATASNKQAPAKKQKAVSKGFDAKTFLASCSHRSGVYQMYDANGQHLYIGKAKNLKKRLGSYFQRQHSNNKTAVLVKKIARIDVTVTRTETEALVLERNLITTVRPPYNVIFRDDKSYPYIYLSDHEYPRLSFFRGKKRGKGRYFGPFPSSHSVRESLNLLQKMFYVRQCEDSFFNNRSRPCLQHQIGRCSAPCVQQINTEAYTETVRQSVLFLEGKSDTLGRELQNAMQQAADRQAYEIAAEKRDQIQHLRHVQEKQFVEGSRGDTDILGAAISAGEACIQVLYVRRGRVLGSRSYYPKPGLIDNCGELLESFIAQAYLNSEGTLGTMPSEIIVSEQLPSAGALSEALSAQAAKRIQVLCNVKTTRARWLRIAAETAQQNLSARLHSREQIAQRFEQLHSDLQLEELPQRIECFDISHSSGEQTVASCVVFDHEGAKKSDYRKFNIEGITGGDDYAAMQQAISRRYTRLKKGEAPMPDILLIDGGKGQLTQASNVLNELQIDSILLIGVAKGSDRKAGLETLFIGAAQKAVTLPPDSSSLHLIQQIRDEAHRFAITGHRARRAKKRNSSPLEEIQGIGPKRRQQLLKHFGGWQAIERASLDELIKVEGISKKIAQDVYAALHNA
jgi:excinuclease ABC subunit C